MGIQVISDVPGPPPHRRLGGAVRVLIGFLLAATGLVGATPLLLVVIVVVVSAVTGQLDQDTTATKDLVVPLLIGFGSIIVLFIGLRLIRGRRRLVLFLRRFGFLQAGEALTFAVCTATGRRWRLVTLDDDKTEAVGQPTGRRRTLRFGRLILGLGFVGCTVWAISWFLGDAPGELIEGLFKKMHDGMVAQGQNEFVAIFPALIMTVVLGIVLLTIAFALILVPLALAGTVTVFTWGSWRAMRKAERAKSQVIREKNQIEPVVRRLGGRARKIFAPRLAVLRVGHDIWRDVVKRLAVEAAVVLIDVSEPTESLLWEVAQVKELDARHILVGNRENVERIAREETISGPASRLRQLLDGENVLVYEQQGKTAMRRFAANLRHSLEQTL